MSSTYNRTTTPLRTEYSGFHKFLHWAVAVCVIFMIPAGFIMGSLPQGDLQNTVYNLHKATGLLVLGLMLVRLANRLIAGAPPSEPSITTFQRIASHSVHGSLYVLLLAQPLLGWAANSYYGAVTPFFGLFEIPAAAVKDEALAERLFGAHNLIGFAIAGLIIVHIGAALYHYFVRRDGVLQRMLPG